MTPRHSRAYYRAWRVLAPLVILTCATLTIAAGIVIARYGTPAGAFVTGALVYGMCRTGYTMIADVAKDADHDYDYYKRKRDE